MLQSLENSDLGRGETRIEGHHRTRPGEGTTIKKSLKSGVRMQSIRSISYQAASLPPKGHWSSDSGWLPTHSMEGTWPLSHIPDPHRVQMPSNVHGILDMVRKWWSKPLAWKTVWVLISMEQRGNRSRTDRRRLMGRGRRSKLRSNLVKEADLAKDNIATHVHGEGAEMEQHLICWQVLLNDILSINSNDGDTDEEVEVVSLVVCPACFPHAQCICLRKLALEA